MWGKYGIRCAEDDWLLSCFGKIAVLLFSQTKKSDGPNISRTHKSISNMVPQGRSLAELVIVEFPTTTMILLIWVYIWMVQKFQYCQYCAFPTDMIFSLSAQHLWESMFIQLSKKRNEQNVTLLIMLSYSMQTLLFGSFSFPAEHLAKPRPCKLSCKLMSFQLPGRLLSESSSKRCGRQFSESCCCSKAFFFWNGKNRNNFLQASQQTEHCEWLVLLNVAECFHAFCKKIFRFN